LLIEIFGLACPKCEATVRVLEATAKRLGIEAEVRLVTNLKEMTARGVVRTPAVFIDGVKISDGGVPNKSLAEGWLRAAMRREDK